MHQEKAELTQNPRALASKTVLKAGGERPSHSHPVSRGQSEQFFRDESTSIEQSSSSFHGTQVSLRPTLCFLSSPSSATLSLLALGTTRLQLPPLSTPLHLRSCVFLPGMSLPLSFSVANSCSPVRIHLRYHLLQEALPESHRA